MSSTTKREYIEVIVVLVAFAIAVVIAITTLPRRGDVIVINCELSEISPDFTNSMREACRQARANNISKDLQKPK